MVCRRSLARPRVVRRSSCCQAAGNVQRGDAAPIIASSTPKLQAHPPQSQPFCYLGCSMGMYFFYLLITLIHLRSAMWPPICRLGEATKSHQVQQHSLRSTWQNIASTPTVHQWVKPTAWTKCPHLQYQCSTRGNWYFLSPSCCGSKPSTHPSMFYY